MLRVFRSVWRAEKRWTRRNWVRRRVSILTTLRGRRGNGVGRAMIAIRVRRTSRRAERRTRSEVDWYFFPLFKIQVGMLLFVFRSSAYSLTLEMVALMSDCICDVERANDGPSCGTIDQRMKQVDFSRHRSLRLRSARSSTSFTLPTIARPNHSRGTVRLSAHSKSQPFSIRVGSPENCRDS